MGVVKVKGNIKNVNKGVVVILIFKSHMHYVINYLTIYIYIYIYTE